MDKIPSPVDVELVQQSGPAPEPETAALMASAAALLAACGGGGGSAPAPTPSPPPPPPPPPPPSPSDAEAARFLAQAGFAASLTDIAAVKTKGYAGWLDEQLALPVQGSTRYDWMVANGFNVDPNGFAGADAAIWAKLVGSPDALRQRMTLALSEIMVTSMGGLPIPFRALAITHYADLLERNAFGSYRTLLQDVTLSVAMGTYLNMMGNKKEDARTGRAPDENYAREVMQLFSIGLYQLNADGSRQMSNGKPVDSYTQTDITQLARVFTGWDRDRIDGNDFAYVTRPLKHNAANFSTGDKTVLGTVISGSLDGPAALAKALDLLANHPNVGPFIGRQLIQRFTQSNPSAAYVGRVAAVFNDNGSGVRGDLKAVLRAVLLDSEARATPSGNASGRLREPVQRFVQWARTFGLKSTNGKWAIPDLSDPATRLGQSPFRSPSVFNFFRPGYVPPGNELGANQVTAPEFQLFNESTVAGYLNYMQGVVQNGLSSGDMVPDYTAELALSTDAAALMQRLNLRLAGGGLADTTVNALVAALNTISAGTDAGKLNRVRAGVLLTLAAPEYLIQK